MLTIILNNIGAVVVVLFGAACLIAPTAVAEWVSFRLEGERGRAEFRTGFGGFFLAPGLFALITQDPVAFTVLGVAWAGTAAARVISFIIDRPGLTATYLGLLAFEIAMGVFMLV